MCFYENQIQELFAEYNLTDLVTSPDVQDIIGTAAGELYDYGPEDFSVASFLLVLETVSELAPEVLPGSAFEAVAKRFEQIPQCDRFRARYPRTELVTWCPECREPIVFTQVSTHTYEDRCSCGLLWKLKATTEKEEQ